MLKQTVNSPMHIEGEDVFKSSMVYDAFDTFNKKMNIRVYTDGEDFSKSSFVSNELNTLRTDLYNATKSLEKSLSMAECLKVNGFRIFVHLNIFNVSVKESLRNVAVDKQMLAMRLQESQKGNDKLCRQVIEQRKNFRNKTNQMQYEIDEIKNSLAATKVL